LARSTSLRDRAGVLLDRVQQHHEVPRSLIQDAVADVCESDAQLTKLAVNLGGDRELRRRRGRRATIQVLLDVFVDLRRPL
jgi:hypothetical protein